MNASWLAIKFSYNTTRIGSRFYFNLIYFLFQSYSIRLYTYALYLHFLASFRLNKMSPKRWVLICKDFTSAVIIPTNNGHPGIVVNTHNEHRGILYQSMKCIVRLDLRMPMHMSTPKAVIISAVIDYRMSLYNQKLQFANKHSILLIKK